MEYRLQSMYNDMVGRAASVLFYTPWWLSNCILVVNKEMQPKVNLNGNMQLNPVFNIFATKALVSKMFENIHKKRLFK